MGALLVLAMLGQPWAIHHDPWHRIELVPLVSLRPKGGIPMFLQRRSWPNHPEAQAGGSASFHARSASPPTLGKFEPTGMSLSSSAIENAKKTELPLFVIDVSTLPLDNEPQRLKELSNPLYIIMDDNVGHGFYPAADRSYNVHCERKAFGMGPEDHQWHKERAYLHFGAADCTDQSDCPGCELVLLHECNGGAPDAMTCPDTWCIFREGITPIEMYTQPDHLAKSHIPDFPNRFNPNAKEPPPGWLATIAVQMVGSADDGF